MRPGLKAGNSSGKWPSLFALASSILAALSSEPGASLRFGLMGLPMAALLPPVFVNGNEPADFETHVTSRCAPAVTSRLEGTGLGFGPSKPSAACKAPLRGACAVPARRSPKPSPGLNSDAGPLVKPFEEDIRLPPDSGKVALGDAPLGKPELPSPVLKAERRVPAEVAPAEAGGARPREAGSLDWACLPLLNPHGKVALIEATVLPTESCGGSVPMLLVEASAGSGSCALRFAEMPGDVRALIVGGTMVGVDLNADWAASFIRTCIGAALCW